MCKIFMHLREDATRKETSLYQKAIKFIKDFSNADMSDFIEFMNKYHECKLCLARVEYCNGFLGQSKPENRIQNEQNICQLTLVEF